MTNTCAQCGRIYDPAKPHDCADRTAFTHGLELMDDPLAGKVMHAKAATLMAADLARAAVEAIVKRLTPWLEHSVFCATNNGYDTCTCGLDAALGFLAEESVCGHGIYHHGCPSCQCCPKPWPPCCEPSWWCERCVEEIDDCSCGTRQRPVKS